MIPSSHKNKAINTNSKFDEQLTSVITYKLRNLSIYNDLAL